MALGTKETIYRLTTSGLKFKLILKGVMLTIQNSSNLSNNLFLIKEISWASHHE